MIALSLLFALAPDVSRLSLRVLVVDGAGAPAPDALVQVLRLSGPEPERPAAGATGGDGVALLELPTDLWSPLVRTTLAVEDGRGRLGLRDFGARELAAGETRVELHELVPLELRTDPPTAGLEAWLRYVEVERGFCTRDDSLAVFASVTTDEDGSARFQVPAISRCGVQLRAPSGHVLEQVGRPGEPCELVLLDEPPGVSFQLSLEADVPEVLRQRRLRIGLYDRSGWRELVERTDEEGRLALGTLPPGPVQLELELEPGDPLFMPAASLEAQGPLPGAAGPLRVSAGERVSLVPVALGRGGLAGEGGEPVGGALLELRTNGARMRVRSDATGAFAFPDPRLTGSAEAALTLTVLQTPAGWRADDPLELRWSGLTGRRPPAPGETWRVELSRARPMRAQVVDPEGRAVSRAWVQASWRVVDGRYEQRASCIADEEGWFELADVPAEEVTLRAGSGPLTSGPPRTVPVGTTRVSLREPPADEPVLRALDPSGAPTPGVRVSLWEDQTEIWSGWTDAAGAVRVVRLEPALERRLELGGGRVVREQQDGPWLERGEEVVRARPLGPLGGRVMDTAGQPVPGAVVRHPGTRVRQAVTDVDGRFVLERVDRFRALLTVRADGFRTGGTIAPPDAREVELRLARFDEPAAPLPVGSDPLGPDGRRALARRLLEAGASSERGGHPVAPRREPGQEPPADARALRLAWSRDQNLPAHELVARWIARGGWEREELLDMLRACVREHLERYDLPRALTLAASVAERDPALAREAVWDLLDRVPPVEPYKAAINAPGEAARMALALARIDPILARGWFAADGALARDLVARGYGAGYTGTLRPVVDWLRLDAPGELLGLTSGPGDPELLAALRHLSVEALEMERDEVLDLYLPG